MKNVPVWLMKAALTCSFLAIIFTATPSYAIIPIGSPSVDFGGTISVMPEFEVSATSVGKNEAYTLTLPPAGRLEEKVGTGSWAYLGHGIREKTLSKNVAGTYYYRVVRDKCNGGTCMRSFFHSPTITVTVNGGPSIPLDSLEDQGQYKFEIRTGDINLDGRKDIHIRRISGNANNGVINETLLQQRPDSTFKVSAATSNQLATAGSWPKANIQAILYDFNLDGFIDLFLQGVGGTITGAKDQMVFSSGAQYNGIAQKVTNINDNFKKTFTSVANWIIDKDYFRKNILSRSKIRYFWRYFCSWGECRYLLAPQRITYYYYDPEKISADGVLFARGLSYCMTNSELVAGSNEAKAINSVLQRVLGTRVMNGVLVDSGGSLPYEDVHPSNARFLRVLAKLFKTVEVVTTSGNALDVQPMINHYTGADGYKGISKNEYVRAGEDGYAYFTPDIYFSGKKAKSRLALRKKPIGYFIFNMDDFTSGFEAPRKVTPYNNEPGGGIEIRHKGNAYSTPYRWIIVK
jgi:hypothetical protein